MNISGSPEPAPSRIPSSSRASKISFRDPAGYVLSIDGRILRVVNHSGIADLNAFLASKTAQALMQAGHVVPTRILSPPEVRTLASHPALSELSAELAGEMVLEHARIPFPSFPYEWPPEMLYAAGELTLRLAQELLKTGLGVKDGTPYNVLFRGPEPVFVDVLSVERRDPGDPTWLAYAQLVRTFLLPLLANRYFGLPLDQIFTTRRDGLEPEEVFGWLKPWQKIRPPFLSLVSLPAWLGARQRPDDASIYRKKSLGNPEKAQFILDSLLRRLSRTLASLAPKKGRRSAWSDYLSSNNTYSPESFLAKQTFVERAMQEFSPKTVLDVGCNTGAFSALAARHHAAVVAIDSDAVVVGEVWRNARAQNLNILPLVVNLTRPTPSIGWRNQECPSFLDRARGAFDCVLMLAVIHHMLVSERVPLPDVLELAAELTTSLLIIEFIAPGDSMFRRLTRGRDELHKDLTRPAFESACRQRFEVIRGQRLEDSERWLYLLRKKP